MHNPPDGLRKRVLAIPQLTSLQMERVYYEFLYSPVRTNTHTHTHTLSLSLTYHSFTATLAHPRSLPFTPLSNHSSLPSPPLPSPHPKP